MDQLCLVAADVDRHVGGRMRERRQALGISQSALGRQLGLTFSQIQKYEKGANRIGAGRLFAMAHLLGVAVEHFYEGIGSASSRPAPAPGRAGSCEAMLLEAYHSIGDPAVQASLIALTQSLAGGRGSPQLRTGNG